MEIVVKGEPKEIAALIAMIQEQQKEKLGVTMGAGTSLLIQRR